MSGKGMNIKMKKVLLVLMSVLWLGTLVSAPVRAEEALQEVETTELSQIMLANGEVEAKEMPDDNAAVVITYESGAPVLVIGEITDGWYKVSYQDKMGYVHKSALTTQELDVEGLNKEMEAAEAENKLVVEEVERYRAEARRSRIWGTIIVLLVVGIFATGILSTVKAEREKRKDAGSHNSREIDSLEVNTGEMEKGLLQEEMPETKIEEDIIDLDKEE